MNATKPKTDVRKIAVVGMLCALSYLMTFVLHFSVEFLTFDCKDAILAVAALLYGPVYGVGAAALVCLLEFITISDTGLYGLVMNFLASGTFALVCGLVYRYRRTFSGAILSVILAVVSAVCVMLVANLFITPFYMGVERTAVVAMIPTLLLPFNLCKTVLNASITMLIYKPITRALRKIGVIEGETGGADLLRSIVAAIVSVVLILLAVLFLLLRLNGAFRFF